MEEAMANEPSTPAPAGTSTTPTPPATPQTTDYKPPATQADLDKIITERINRERQKFADYDDMKRKAGEFDKLDEASKSDLQKANDRATALEKERDTERARALRLEVASAKGLTPAQAKRLAGATKEELEADADEILEAFPTAPSGGPPSRQPRQNLRGGGDPTSEDVETDPAKLAELVPRY